MKFERSIKINRAVHIFVEVIFAQHCKKLYVPGMVVSANNTLHMLDLNDGTSHGQVLTGTSIVEKDAKLRWIE